MSLDIAPSYAEAAQRVQEHYDAIFLRADLRLDGRPHSSQEKLDLYAPFFKKIYYDLNEGRNKATPLYVLAYTRDLADYMRREISKQDSITKSIYLGEEKPSTFAHDIIEKLLRDELRNFKDRRSRSRIDG